MIVPAGDFLGTLSWGDRPIAAELARLCFEQKG
jgi:hypothetical protein